MRVLPSYEGGRVERLAFSGDGRWLVSVASHPRHRERSAPPRLWSRFDGSQLYAQPVSQHYGRCLALAADGSVSAWEATTTRSFITTRVVCLWDTLEAAERFAMPCPPQTAQLPVAFSNDGERLVMVGQEGDGPSIYSARTGAVVSGVLLDIVDPISISAITFASDAAEVAAAIDGFGRTAVDLTVARREIALPNYGGTIEEMKFTGDGSAIALRRSQELALLQVPTGTVRWSLSGVRPASIAFSPDGRSLAGAFANGSIAFWDVADGHELRRYRWDIGALGAIAFAPDGMTCAAGGDNGRIVIWDLDD